MKDQLQAWFWGDGWHVRTHARAFLWGMLAMTVWTTLFTLLGTAGDRTSWFVYTHGGVVYGSVLGWATCVRHGRAGVP